MALSYKEAAKFFPSEKVALTSQPVRAEIAAPLTDGAREFLKIETDTPVVLILGGSLGAERINETIYEGLKSMIEKYVVIHQTGKNNFLEAKSTAAAVLFDSQHKERYKPFDYLNALAMRMAAGVSSIVVSRAGSAIFEIAAWGTPSIIVPISDSNGDHQRQNAFAYARTGACEVIEEANLKPNILLSEIDRLMANAEMQEKMRAAAKAFYKPNAARLVAEEVLKIALGHEIAK